MVQQKKPQGDNMPSDAKRDSGMGMTKKDSSGGRGDGSRTQNGKNSNARGTERVLKPWVPDSAGTLDGSLEQLSSGGQWDQFAENERLFGLKKSDYHKNIYTTPIDESHPEHKKRLIAADIMAQEIKRSPAMTSHVAEERVMDYKGADNESGDEEDRYSGVRRPDLSSLLTSSGRENKYTPPAKRAPTGQPTVPGVPVDPAIISSQIRGDPTKKTDAPKIDEHPRAAPPATIKVSHVSSIADNVAASSVKRQTKADETPKSSTDAKASESAQISNKSASQYSTADKPTAGNRHVGTPGRNQSSQANETGPSAASTVGQDVLKEFKSFASQQRLNAEKARSNKAKVDKEVKLIELRKFADTFKLSTPVPMDLISIIAKDPAKQKEIQAKSERDANEAKLKGKTISTSEEIFAEDSQVKTNDSNSVPPLTEPKASASRPTQGYHGTSLSSRQSRQPSGPAHHTQHFRPAQHVPEQSRPGNLGQRLRGPVAQQTRAHHHGMSSDMRPPTGPAAAIDPTFNRRLSGAHGHVGPKLNPNSHEFRPNPFATSFSPNGHPSAGSSPRAGASNMNEAPLNQSPPGQLVRRKTKAVDVAKCSILAFVKAILPPQGRNWDDNDGLRPSYDTPPTWRQLQESAEKPDSTMHLTFKQYFERHPFVSVATPNPTPSVPHMIHQLAFHPAVHPTTNRGSPQIQSIQMGSHLPSHVPFGDDRMIHSNSQQSAQSFTSPRLPAYQHNMAYRLVNGNVVNGNVPQAEQFRHNWPQGFMVHAGHHQMPVYAVSQFVSATGAPQPLQNGYSSPGTAPPMSHRNSQQGPHQGPQTPYTMSPNMHYQQPYPLGTNKPSRPIVPGQQINQFGRGNGGNGGNMYGGKNLGGHIQQLPGHAGGLPSGQQVRSPEVHEDAK